MFNNIYQGKKVLVTGHTGFKGGWLSLWLKLMGADVYGISDEIYAAPSLFEVSQIESQITSYLADIRNLEEIKSIIGDIKPDFIFHLAAQPIVKRAYLNPVEALEVNIMGTAHILEAIRLLNNPCIAVMITSDKCYDNVEWIWGYKETDYLGGKDPYSASKGGAELVIKTYYHSYFKKTDHIKMASVRAGNVIGGGDWAANRIVPDCFRAWANNEKVIIRSPYATRPWQHVLEPLSGYLQTGQLLAQPTKNSINGEAYNFGPPAEQNHTVLDLINELAVNWSSNDIQNILQVEPSDFVEAGLLKLNIDKALFDMNWKPTLNFIETAEFTTNWYKTYYNNKSADMLTHTNNQIEAYIQIANKRGILWAQK
ncbi:CDP-glucose 4,6-dehydratase [Mucilaginibacter aquatilis]|uniref:CDP-glucose 4,6-dehydratase n=1 Tax=Mucilaginibacter aquatilis TaxID=1517760 RepID=A0A6I4I7J9_9SPHI|nr:CDP-glucose 4,6-dehydratase [Mucilaginibacter aquatilis]MVN91195.1 CDP-glucose 4,6-dehydratase [Mucilaginibacter aquatilis]